LANWKGPAIAGYAVIIFTFIGLGGWSAFAKLDSAVVAQGVVTIETNRKTVQHLEGGIIQEIRVREGQSVQAGETLFRLDTTQARSSLDLQQNQLRASLALEARLTAERNGDTEVMFPEALLALKDDPTVARSIADQLKEFAERRASLFGQAEILRAKIQQYNTEMQGLDSEREAANKQVNFLAEELTGLNYLLQQNLVQKARVLALEREKSRLTGIVGRSTADRAKAENGIAEAELQIRQLRQKFLEEVSGKLVEARQKITELSERARVASDVFQRLDIVAPVSGTAQNLKVFTKGGVIRAGEPLLDIVPDHEALIVEARVSPHDTENLVPDMRVEVRFSSFRTNILPIIMGRVQSVSRDRLMDEVTKQPYFLALVVCEDIPFEVRDHLTAGMPADLIFPTGERSVLDYLVRPLKDRMNSAMRER